MAACLFNSLWICAFVQGTHLAMWCSTVLIACLLFSICKIYVNTKFWAVARPGGVLQKLALDVHFTMYAFARGGGERVRAKRAQRKRARLRR